MVLKLASDKFNKAIAVIVLFTSCGTKDSLSDADVIESGKNIYYKTCLSCHGKNESTLYVPSLEEMSVYQISLITQKLHALRYDSLHSQLLKGDDIDTLIKYIKSYKKYDAIPSDADSTPTISRVL